MALWMEEILHHPIYYTLKCPGKCSILGILAGAGFPASTVGFARSDSRWGPQKLANVHGVWV